VNWFRKDANGKFLWPGFGDNLRVLKWIIERGEGKAGAAETPIGAIPRPEDLDLGGLEGVSPEMLRQLLAVNREEWVKELEGQKVFLESLGPKVPEELRAEYDKLARRLAR
jgi:phosphoenolpyruvate carboxykinase (GTP)